MLYAERAGHRRSPLRRRGGPPDPMHPFPGRAREMPTGTIGISGRAAEAPLRNLGQDLVGDVEVGVDGLDVIEVVQGVDEVEDLAGLPALDGHRGLGDHR
jgi:hypothetical protein